MRSAIFAGFVAVTTVLIGASSVQAAPSTTSPTEGAAQGSDSAKLLTVEEVLRANPKAHLVSPGRVEISKGVILMWPEHRTATVAASGFPYDPCSYGDLCVWEHNLSWPFYGGGYGLAFYYCGLYNLGYLRYPDGAWSTDPSVPKWNDRISSYVNNQYIGTRADFYNWEGSWVPKFYSVAPGYRLNLADTGFNDIVDGIRPC